MKLIPVAVKDSNYTFSAKVIGKSLKCSCTSGALQAAKRLAEKFCGPGASVRLVEPWERLMPTYLKVVPEEQQSPAMLKKYQETLTHFIEE